MVKTSSPIRPKKCGTVEVYDSRGQPTGRLLDVLNRSTATISGGKWAAIKPEKFGWTFASWEV